MTILSEFERAAWERRDSAERFKPVMACKVAVDTVNANARYEHAIVVLVEKHDDGGDYITILQSGGLSQLAVEGALHRAVALSSRGEE